jgi:hypothetical protein
MSAKAGRHDQALECLDKAVDSGYRLADWIAGDPDLKSLHGDPWFEAILAKARNDQSKKQ